MTTDPVWLTIIANTILVAISIANAWLIAWYNQQQGKKKKTPKQESEITRRYWKADLLAAIVFVSSIGSIALAMSNPNADSNVHALQIALNVGYAVLAIVSSFAWRLMEAISGNTKLISSLTDLMGEMTAVVERVAKDAPKESHDPTVESDAHKTDARGSP